MIVNIEEVTPEKATALLAGAATMQRNLSPRVVTRYADEMRAGNWMLNGESIKVGKSGAVIDGQHRLHAVAQSGCTVPMLVVSGVRDEGFITIDTGKPRTAGDALSMVGTPNALKTAAVVGFLIDEYMTGAVGGGNYALRSNRLVTEVAAACPPHMADSVRRCSHRDLSRLASTSALAYSHMRATMTSPALAHSFFEGVASGVGLYTGDPRLTLRNRLIDIHHRGDRVKRHVPVWLISRAWKAFIEEQPLSKLVTPVGREKFPGWGSDLSCLDDVLAKVKGRVARPPVKPQPTLPTYEPATVILDKVLSSVTGEVSTRELVCRMRDLAPRVTAGSADNAIRKARRDGKLTNVARGVYVVSDKGAA